MIDPSRLRALHAVSVHGSVVAAADALGFTPSAISQQIAKLERETDTVLLQRQGRGVVLTEPAQVLVGIAEGVLGLLEQAEAAMEAWHAQPVGQLVLGSFPTASRGLMPQVIADLTRSHPDLDLRLLEVDPIMAVELVASSQVDLAVVHDWHNTPLAVPESLSQLVLGQDIADVLLPADSPLAERDSLSAHDLVGERWICQPPGSICHDWLVRTFRDAGLATSQPFRANEYATQVALIAAGVGVGLLPRLGRGQVPDSVVVRPLLPTPTRRVLAVWRTTTARRPAVTVAVAALTRHWPGPAPIER